MGKTAEMRALVFDFETTGLPFHPNARAHLQPRAIEFAGVLVDSSGAEHGELNFLCHPGQAISAEITKITGITNEALEHQHPFATHIEAVRELMSGADILVAHNLPFDHWILWCELTRIGALQWWPWPKHNLCTAQLYEPLWGRRPRLVELFEAITGNTYQQTHRALDDVRALATIVQQEKLIETVASTPGAYGIHFPTGIRADRPCC